MELTKAAKCFKAFLEEKLFSKPNATGNMSLYKPYSEKKMD